MATRSKKTQLKDVMSKDVVCVPQDEQLRAVAETMRDKGIGDVLVTNADGDLCGIVTDRDIVVRALANGADPATPIRDACTTKLETLSPEDTVEEAVAKMRASAVRRIPVVDHGKPVGIVSIGDLAQARDPKSALGQISAAHPNT
jgi:CBS domain-containing protein